MKIQAKDHLKLALEALTRLEDNLEAHRLRFNTAATTGKTHLINAVQHQIEALPEAKDKKERMMRTIYLLEGLSNPEAIQAAFHVGAAYGLLS
ncbi:MAG: hypothetical protein JRD89_01550 [Deltaproteobacteria bacterium]|nr:hypothetical protein [Deltaproteobacteria bacterium]